MQALSSISIHVRMCQLLSVAIGRFRSIYQFICSRDVPKFQMNRRTSELRMRRVGAVLLCEDTFNQTTCVCNRRDKCNDIHSRLPFATYAEGLFRGVVNFDTIIAAIDPR